MDEVLTEEVASQQQTLAVAEDPKRWCSDQGGKF